MTGGVPGIDRPGIDRPGIERPGIEQPGIGFVPRRAAHPGGGGSEPRAAAAAGLALDGIRHAYDAAPVLRGVSLTVDRGEVVCLLGPSGCGKTTLLRLAAGLERLQHGRIRIGGRVVADPAAGRQQPPEARRVGLMFQDYALFPHLTVHDNVCFGIARTAGTDAWVRSALARMGLAAWERAYPHTLSGGQQQRCALLRALAPHPDILLLDEPFSGLDVALRAQVREETASFLRETGIATLVVTHDPEEAMGLADRILVMRDGVVVQEGTPADIYLRPRDPFVATLFGPVNQWTAAVAGGEVATPIGRFAAPGLAEGDAATVLIRPEAVSLAPAGDGSVDALPAAADAVVLDSRLLGGQSAVIVACDAGGWRLRALVAGVFLPAPGTRVTVAADPARAFVYPAG